MKRCPECRRDYFDETLLYCLDDGTALLEGPASGNEASTAILHSANSSEESIRSIAVLPFVNISADLDNEYFCDGLAEEILNALTKMEGLKVAARTSAFSFKGKNIDVGEIGNALHVNTVLEGSVRKAGNRIRITVQLVNAADGYHLWSERYDREMRDIFAIQDEITISVVNALKLKIFGIRKTALLKRYTEQPEAYHLYLQGRFFWNKRTPDGIEKAVDFFEQAIKIDPNYALAYSGLADCFNSFGFSFDFGTLAAREVIPKAKAAALKALEIDDTLAEAHTSLAYTQQLFDWDWAAAETGFKRALELNPNYANANHWYSHLLIATGRIDESLAQSLRAIELDPLSLVMHTHLGWHYLYAREYNKAIDQLRATLAMDPAYAMAQWYLALAFEQKQQFEEAANEFDRAKQLLEGNAIVEADIAHFYAASGETNKAKEILSNLIVRSAESYVSPFAVALIHVGLSDKEKAFEWLERALEDRSDMMVYVKVEPRLDPLRDDLRFGELVKKAGYRWP